MSKKRRKAYELPIESTNIKLEYNDIIQPKVAIIVPTYNDEKFLRNSLDSILNQSVPYWEAWIIDDCSDDSSPEIIREYCESDTRFHMLRNEVNSSAWVSRAKGILAASESVEYIMFADADDSFVTDAVKRAYNLMISDPVDILHFGTNVENCSIQYNDYLQPPLKKLYGRQIFDSFVERSFEGHIWNKMFNAKLLKDTINHVGVDHVLPKAQDKALYWAVCWQKEELTYRGVDDKLYNYNYGSGIEGNNETINLNQYRQYLSQSFTENLIADIMDEHQVELKQYESVMENSRYNLVRHSVRNWFRVCKAEKAEALVEATKYWDRSLDSARLVCALAEFSWNNSIELSQIAGGVEPFKTTRTSDDIKVIGTYYHRMDNGGIQRVIAKLVEFWHQSSYEVVVFTDSDPEPEDYELPDYVTRVKIVRPFSKCSYTNYVERGMSFASLIREYNVDCMVYHSYFSDVLLYDTLICKCMNVPFVLYQHNVFSRFTRYADPKFATISLFSKLADVVVCLDKTSAEWWRCFNGNVHVVINPPTFDLNSISVAPRNNHNILFLGRLVEAAKHTKDAVEIAAKVVKKIPDAKMYIVGTGEKKYLEELNNLIKKLNMEEHVVMCGFSKEVSDFYMLSSVFLCCSSHEGFPMTLIESQSFGLPIVMYELPYLTITENNQGVISVPQRDTEAAANEICKLFEDSDKLIETGDSARQFVVDMFKEDIGLQWENIFYSINNFNPDFCSERQIQLAETMVRDYLDGITEVEALRKRLEFVEGKLDWNRKELEKKKQQLAENEQNITVKVSENESLSVDTLIQKLNWNRGHNAELEKKRKQSEDKMNWLRETKEEQAVRIRILENNVDSLSNSNLKLREKIRYLREKLNWNRKQKAEFEQKNKTLLEKLEWNREQKSSLEDKVKSLETNLKKCHEDTAKTIANSKNRMIRISAEESISEETVISKLCWNRERVKDLEVKVINLEKKIRVNDEEIMRLKNEKKQIEQEIGNMQKSASMKIGRAVTWLPRKIKERENKKGNKDE